MTVVPTGTVNVVGLKEKSSIAISMLGDVAEGALGDDSLGSSGLGAGDAGAGAVD